jgi:predicted amidophosphoribosyltransferase
MVKLCPICDAPIKGWYAVYCRHCAQALRRARQVARALTPGQKRAIARAAVQSLREHGRVKVRFLKPCKE